MSNIILLDQNTINKIAAGEVVERPSAVVKELVENAIDAGANGITVEIKEGGIRFIRVTDNGIGIPKEEIKLAFKRHSTSKIRSAEDLVSVSSLGFRGEALASISSVAQVELLTKTARAITGCRYIIEGGNDGDIEEIGCPEGTTFLVRNLFYNTPARRKFLKSAMTEAGYVASLVERLAISHPNISFKFINNNQVKLHTSGNGQMKDVIYQVYGREIAKEQIFIEEETNFLKITGFIGKPVISRGNRNYMNYFINGRYIKSLFINRAIEEAYKPYTMSHRYPFTCFNIEIDSHLIDVNVHPTKMEIRFLNQEQVFRTIYDALSIALRGKELIPNVSLEMEQRKAEPFEINLKNEEKEMEFDSSIFKQSVFKEQPNTNLLKEASFYGNTIESNSIQKDNLIQVETAKQLDLFEEKLLSKEARKEHRIIGQFFNTYWLVEFKDKIFMIDQHAAHEKVLFEQTMKSLKEKEFTSQIVRPPILLTLNMREEEVLLKHMTLFQKLGFEIEHFGGKEYSVYAVPGNLYGISEKELLLEIIDDLVTEDGKHTPDILLEKIASMSCKAAVKGNSKLSYKEIEELIDKLLTLENPYHCPHGRPTIISMSRYEIEKKFKRIVS